MNRLTTVAAIAAVLFAGAAQAQQRMPSSTSPALYGELGYTWLELRDNPGFRVNPGAVRGIIGYNFHPNFAVEGMAAIGAGDDSALGVDFKLRNAYGVFAKPRIEFNNFEAFARLGWVHQRVRASAGGFSVSGSDSDFAWGLGANYNFNPRTYVGLDYMRLFEKGSARIDGWTVSVGYRF